MTRYRKKPLVVQAVRIQSIDGEGVVFSAGAKAADWLYEAIEKGVGEEGGLWVLNQGVRIGTLEGTMRAEAGDYIVQGVKGEIYAVREDIFRETYEPIND